MPSKASLENNRQESIPKTGFYLEENVVERKDMLRGINAFVKLKIQRIWIRKVFYVRERKI